jgi:tetratricopeptide (TPR) repeat protein
VVSAEGDKTPPLLSPNAHLKANKKRSPTSTFEFHHAEEMKVAVPDEHYQDSLVRMLQQLIPHPLAIDPNDSIRSDGFGDPSEIKAKPATKQKPPLKPSPKRFPRSDSDQSAGDGHQGQQDELSMVRLADDCLENNDFTTALGLYKSLLQELDKVYGRSHSRTAQCVHQIGECYLLLGDFGKAIRYLETAIHIRSLVLGVHHLDVAASMEKLAVAQLHFNEVEVAHDVYRRALRIKRSLLGLYHEDVAHIQTQLACIYFYSGELLSAQAAFEEALDVYRHLTSLSPGNPGLWLAKSADTLGSIGSIKLSQKRYSCAVQFFSDALKVSLNAPHRTSALLTC